MKPGPKPMAELERLFQGLFPERELAGIYEQVEAGQLVKVVQQLSEKLEQQKQAGQRFLLVIDQFEEVFTLTKWVEQRDSKAERQAQLESQRNFIEPLLAVGALADSPLAVVVTMRSDFVDAWLATGQPTAVVQEQAVYVGPLQGEALEMAIVEPAKQQGYGFGAGLLPLILADVGAEPNSLPLLEFALTQLWEQRDEYKRQLAAETYQQLGQLQGGLECHAEKVYESLGRQEKGWAKKIFLALTRIGTGEQDTRQRRKYSELMALEVKKNEQENIESTIQALSSSQSRLLVADENMIDLSHESLMIQWNRFKEWLSEDREVRRLALKLEEALQDWLTNDKSKDYLPTKGLLRRVEVQENEVREYITEVQLALYKEAQIKVELPEILNQSYSDISAGQDLTVNLDNISHLSQGFHYSSSGLDTTFNLRNIAKINLRVSDISAGQDFQSSVIGTNSFECDITKVSANYFSVSSDNVKSLINCFSNVEANELTIDLTSEQALIVIRDSSFSTIQINVEEQIVTIEERETSPNQSRPQSNKDKQDLFISTTKKS